MVATNDNYKVEGGSAQPVYIVNANTPALSAPTTPASTIIGVTLDGGSSQSLTRQYTANADISTARDITNAPGAGLKVVATDIYISVNTEALVTIQMETSGNVLAAAYMTENSTIAFTLRGYLKGDTANKKLQMKSSVASAAVCTCVYFTEA